MWTLTYEMQMYVLLPVIFFFVRRNFSLWPLLMLWFFVYAECHQLFRGVPHNFFLCIPYFLPGIMAYVGFGRRRPILPAWTLPFALAGVYLVFLRWPEWRIGNLVCLAVGLGLPSFRQMSSRWLIRASHEVAKYSYGIYLTHPFALVFGIYLMPHRPLVFQLAVVLISLTVISVGAYHLLERPMIRLGARLAERAELRFEQYEAPFTRRKPEDRAVFEPRPTE
jgi:peptidoglycan/LPS O-acetylase OafA/YrhL